MDSLVTKGQRSCPASLKRMLEGPDYIIVWLVPFAVYLILALLYTYHFMTAPSLCVIMTILGVFGSCAFFIFQGRYEAWFALSIALLPAITAGTFFGLYFYDSYAIFPMFYANSRTYTNVLPSQPSAAVADAGMIVFSSESYVHTNQSVGYITEEGRTYCVAPVRDRSATQHVQFWAVGINCCAEKGGFYCDSTGDAAAHAGVVVFDNDGIFAKSRYDYYERARLKAEAEFSLLSTAKPLYIRWVQDSNLDMLSNHYGNQATLFLVIVSVFYLFLSAGLAYALCGQQQQQKRPVTVV